MKSNFAILGKIDPKFERNNNKAKYFEMIFEVLKLKFDEDKARSLSSQILTKSAKSTQKTSRSTLFQKFRHHLLALTLITILFRRLIYPAHVLFKHLLRVYARVALFWPYFGVFAAILQLKS